MSFRVRRRSREELSEGLRSPAYAAPSDDVLDELAELMSLQVERLATVDDREVIGAAVACGMPVMDAQNQLRAGGRIAQALRLFYLDFIDSKTGDPLARERIEMCREMWGRMTERRLAQERMA